MSDEAEYLRHGILEGGGEVVALQELLYLVRVLLYPLRHGFRYAVDMGSLMQIACGEACEGGELLYHRWDDEVVDACDDAYHGEHGKYDAQGSDADVELFLDEYHEWIHEVCQYPCDEERQEYGAEVVEHKECENYDSADDGSADEAIEGYFLFEHGVGIFFEVSRGRRIFI